METTTLTQSNYINDYSALQLSLPIDLGIKIDEDDMVISFLKALEGVNLSKHFKKEGYILFKFNQPFEGCTFCLYVMR